jgi:hypothetical protein
MLSPELVAKLQECAQHNFAGTRDYWFSRQTIFEVLVIVGLVLEGPELLHELLSIIQGESERFKNSFFLSRKYVNRAKFVALLGWMVIIGGLFGEIRASSKIKVLSDKIEGCSDAKLTEARLDADEAVLEAYKTVSFLADRRLNDPPKFVELLKGKPKTRIELWYNPNDSEAWTFAREIFLWLGKGPSKRDGAGWQVSPPIPIPANEGILTMNEFATAPVGMRFDAVGSRSGLTFLAKNLLRDETNRQTAIGALQDALSRSILPLGTRFTSVSGAEIPSLPADLIILIVGPKPTWYFGLDERGKAIDLTGHQLKNN